MTYVICMAFDCKA